MEQVTENCISLILSFTSPWDTCRASGVSNEFKSAADSDELWNKFLPSDVTHILTRSLSEINYTTKRHLYFLLADSPVLLDDGNLVILHSFLFFTMNFELVFFFWLWVMVID